MATKSAEICEFSWHKGNYADNGANCHIYDISSKKEELLKSDIHCSFRFKSPNFDLNYRWYGMFSFRIFATEDGGSQMYYSRAGLNTRWAKIQPLIMVHDKWSKDETYSNITLTTNTDYVIQYLYLGDKTHKLLVLPDKKESTLEYKDSFNGNTMMMLFGKYTEAKDILVTTDSEFYTQNEYNNIIDKL